MPQIIAWILLLIGMAYLPTPLLKSQIKWCITWMRDYFPKVY